MICASNFLTLSNKFSPSAKSAPILISFTLLIIFSSNLSVVSVFSTRAFSEEVDFPRDEMNSTVPSGLVFLVFFSGFSLIFSPFKACEKTLVHETQTLKGYSQSYCAKYRTLGLSFSSLAKILAFLNPRDRCELITIHLFLFLRFLRSYSTLWVNFIIKLSIFLVGLAAKARERTFANRAELPSDSEAAEKAATEISDVILKTSPGDRWDMIADKINAALDARDEELFSTARDFIDAADLVKRETEHFSNLVAKARSRYDKARELFVAALVEGVKG